MIGVTTDAKHLKNIIFEHIVFLKIRHMILIASQLVMSFFGVILMKKTTTTKPAAAKPAAKPAKTAKRK